MINFYIGNLWGAISEANGMVLMEDNGLHITFVKTDVEPDIMEKDFYDLSIPWNQISDLIPDYGFTGNELEIVTQMPQVHKVLNKAGKNTIKLKVRKKDKKALEDFVNSCQSVRAGETLVDVDSVMDDMQDFLDGV